MTRTPPAIQIGSLAIATRASGVCDVGERGVCYEMYELAGRPGCSFLFERVLPTSLRELRFSRAYSLP